MKILVGLGNPGEKYKNHRHNIGFWVVDAIAEKYQLPAFKSKFEADITTGEIDGEKVCLIKPLTYMNKSGQSVQKALAFYKAQVSDVYVFHDEIDVEPLKVKIKTGGGEAGHNGLRSISQCLGNPNYHRVRIGVGHPGHKDRVHGYVLSDFAKNEKEDFAILSCKLAEVTPLILQNDFAKALTNLKL